MSHPEVRVAYELFEVPVVFLSGDRAIVDQAKGLFGDIETVAVKEGIGVAELGKHPLVANQEITRIGRIGDSNQAEAVSVGALFVTTV